MEDIWDGIQDWLTGIFGNIPAEAYLNLGAKLLKIILIVVVAKILIRIGRLIISGFFQRHTHGFFKVNERKTNTLKALSQSILKYLVYFIAGIMILEELGVKTTSVIATAGIGGLAIGFGAQNLVKDIITGFFILFEDQYAVGDFITIDDITGTVEEIGLRITKIRGFKGDLNIIPNGQVSKVTNFTRGNVVAVVDMNISYETDIDQAIRVMEEVSRKYAGENKDIVEEPQVLGVTNIGNPEISIRIIARTLPMKHWGVERELRKRIKEAFDNNNIEIPYPRRVVIEKK